MKRFFVLALILAVAGMGCGKKGAPRAPELVTPKTITNLAARSGPNSIILTWNPLTEYVDGSSLKDLASFVIFRKEVSQSCPDCPVPYRQLTTVYLEDRH